ncbi:MAG: DUF1295 domain-containing protein [Patescibacteria group bacterium]
MILLTSLGIALGINMLMFIPAYIFRTDKLTDISYAITFVVLALYGFILSAGNIFTGILLAIISIWAARLGGYLLIRIRKTGKDKRFDTMRNNFWKFIRFWILQGFTVWAVLIPSILFFGNHPKQISSFAYIGIGAWMIGLLIEAFADIQKYRFINDLNNKGKWIDTGLWKYSRHPNYFGEILLWVGVYVYTVFGLSTGQAVLGLIGPLYIACLIIFVSGIPLLEKAADKRWGSDQNYQQYKKRTSVLIPLPPKNIS